MKRIIEGELVKHDQTSHFISVDIHLSSYKYGIYPNQRVKSKDLNTKYIQGLNLFEAVIMLKNINLKVVNNWMNHHHNREHNTQEETHQLYLTH